MLFGGENKKGGNTGNDLMDMLGVPADEAYDEAIMFDDAVVAEDDAIIVEDAPKPKAAPKTAKKAAANASKLTEDEMAILNAAK
jgi:hypothetical protein